MVIIFFNNKTFPRENKQEFAHEMGRENTVSLLSKVSLKRGDGRLDSFCSSCIIHSRSLSRPCVRSAVCRKRVGSAQPGTRRHCVRLVRAVTILDCIHDTVGEDGHLSRDRLHSLFELCNVRAGGKHVVQA